LEEKDNTPDWLKDSLTERLPEKEEVKKEDFKEEKEDKKDSPIIPFPKGDEDKEPVIVEDKAEEKLKLDSEEDVPDWLK
jgi:hypothetical protein